jgi:hypothetical protein
MTNRLKQRVLNLELAKNPEMGIEDWLRKIKDGNEEPIRYVPGASKLADFIHSLSGEVMGGSIVG